MYHLVVLTTIVSCHLAILYSFGINKNTDCAHHDGSTVLSLLYVCLCHLQIIYEFKDEGIIVVLANKSANKPFKS